MHKQLEDDHLRQSSRQPQGCVHEHEGLFIGPHFQQAKSEDGQTADACPDVLVLFGESERPAATANARLHLSCLHLRQRQHPPEKGFSGAKRQGVGGRSANYKGWK